MCTKEPWDGDEGRVMKPRDRRPLLVGLTILIENLVGGRRTVGVAVTEVVIVLLLWV